MSHDVPQLAIDADPFSSALQAGELDVCLSYLGRIERIGRGDAQLNRRLAEALFHCGRTEEALDCGRRSLALAPSDPETLYFCAWLFSNAGAHGEAAAAYRALLEIDPDWAEGYRHASGSLAADGASDLAADYAIEASARAPHDPEYALHAAAALLAVGRPEAAAIYAERAAVLALAGDPSQIEAAELLLRCGSARSAADFLHAAAAKQAGHPVLFRVLSAAEMMCGNLDAALAAIDAALAITPKAAEYHVHRGYLLLRLRQSSAAEAALQEAEVLDPTNPDLTRVWIDLHLMQGRVSEATALGGALLHAHPDDPAATDTMLRLLRERMRTIDGDYLVLHGVQRQARPVRPLPGFLDRLHSQRRVIRALIIRETRTRFGDSRLGYGWALLEPVLHIALLSVAFSMLMHGQPPIGNHFFVFYYTGLVPYHVFVHTSSAMAHAITSNGALLELPTVTTFDVIAARGLLEIATDVIVAVIMLIGFGATGLSPAPDDLWAPLTAFAVTASFGCGVGYINGVVAVFWRGWDKIFAQLTRALYFVSGIFYVPAMMPDWLRDVLLWNPLLHAIDWFRSGFFAAYQPHWLDRSYLTMIAILALLAGMGLERGLRRRLSDPL